MTVDWEFTAQAFFDQLSRHERIAIERSVDSVTTNWDQTDRTRLQRLEGFPDESAANVYALRAGPDLRVLLRRSNDQIKILDIVRQSQIERLRYAETH